MSRLLLPMLLLLTACPEDKDDPVDSASGYDDLDGDGYDSSLDCDDINSAVHPDATELCNTLDDDCDGETDEAGAAGGTMAYTDSDGDGYGDEASGVRVCAPVEGTVAVGGDCDDADATESPVAAEICDGDDDDCDGETDEVGATGGSLYHQDADGDGYGHPSTMVEACAEGDGAVSDATDCDDADASRNPAAEETCDGDDDDCDGAVDEDATDTSTWYLDADQDRFGTDAETVTGCDAPDGYAATGGDCDDGDSSVNPARAELCDGLDNDCDDEIDEGAVGAYVWYTDADGDGYGDEASETRGCDLPEGVIETGGDCDDGDAAVNPAQEEACDDSDGLDNDCDGRADPACGGSNTGRANFQYAMDTDPSYRSCDQWWDNTWTITSAGCPECEWTADVDFAYDAASSSTDGSPDCVAEGSDWTWTFGFDDDYYGYQVMWYYAGSYGDWYPVWLATWDRSTYELTTGGGYYEYPYRYGSGTVYYTANWAVTATVYPY